MERRKGGVVRLVLLFAAAATTGRANAAAAGDDASGAPASTTAGDNNADCIGLGFTGLNRCSDCDSLRDFTKNDAITAECKRCCAKDSNKVSATFDEARLEICK